MRYHQQPRSRLAAGIVVAGLTLASCGSGGGQSTATPPAVSETTGSTAAPVAESTPTATDADSSTTTGAPSTTAAGDAAVATVPPTTTAAPVDNGLSPAENAEANSANLTTTDDARTTEVLSLADGSITSIQQAATGDRPVLLWFWAPH